MTFLNPLVLFGLAAAAIPIVLHLLNIRKLRTIEFSTLRFLKELQKNRMRKVKLRQWLLLALRTLLIILVVLAFSRPALRGSFAGLDSHAKTTIVVVLDNTASMAASNERGSYLLQAKEAALSIASLLTEGDDALLIRLSDLPSPAMPAPTHDVAAFRDALVQTQTAAVHRTLDDGLRLAARMLEQSRNLNQEIYLLTDNRHTSYAISAESAQEHLFRAGVKLFLVPLAERPLENTGIASVVIPPSLQQKGKPFVVKTVIHNYGTQTVSNIPASLFFDGARVAQKNLTVGAGENAAAEFTVIPQRTGFCGGSIEIDDDDLESDNRAFFSVYIPESIHALLIAPDVSSARYIRLALTAPLQDSSSARIIVRDATPAQLTSQMVSQSDVIILSGIPSLTETQTALLSSALKNDGKGILLFPGTLCDGTAWNRNIMPLLGLPAAVWTDTALQRSGAFVTFANIDREHPIFQSMFDQAPSSKMNIESPHITQRMFLTSEQKVRSIITLSDTKSFLWEKGFGSGMVLGFSVAPDPAWSDFPLKGIFLPLLQQSLFYAAQGVSGSGLTSTVFAGNSIDLPLSRIHRQSASQQLTLTAPDSTEEIVIPYNLNRGNSILPLVSLEHIRLAGLYAVRQGRDIVALLPVQPDPLESDGTLAEASAVKRSATALGIPSGAITTINQRDKISSTVLQSRYGLELWIYFLIAALCVAIIEMLIAKESKND